MQPHDVFQSLNARQVHALVPLHQKRIVAFKNCKLVLRQGAKREELLAQKAAKRAHWAKRRYTSRTAIAAGVTPGITDAPPSVVGRTRFSFSRTSVDSPGMS